METSKIEFKFTGVFPGNRKLDFAFLYIQGEGIWKDKQTTAPGTRNQIEISPWADDLATFLSLRGKFAIGVVIFEKIQSQMNYKSYRVISSEIQFCFQVSGPNIVR